MTQGSCTITVVTPVLNGARFIRRTIESVLAQEGNFTLEYIICDGGSTDATIDIVREYGERCWFIQRSDSGPADAINYAMGRAQGAIGCWLGADDLLSPGALNRVVEAFAEKDMVLIAMSEVGFIYTMSTHPIATLEDLRKSKSWAPEGDPLSLAFIEAVGITPIPLSLPDVLVSLQTGMVNTVFNGYYGSIVLQWFTKVKYITDFPFGYAYGSLVFDKKALDRLPEGHLAIIKAAAGKYFTGKLKDDTRRTNVEALETLKANGITVVPADPAVDVVLAEFRDQVVAESVGKYFSAEIYNEMMTILENYRKSRP